ncbi:hypothetical protein VB796_03295 [Arcicella sp. LKC2W]|uniref:hypothetical protein n=1 Tax=Arcicella sp. LKC2W TaxID=2984198 RepID=UPI002B1EA8E3|nr:hypothetical protein [Arcicella sp. LKC2W]MEA5458043.1 hypothetical protein [Arcicella sp. LKC2W]
MSSRVMGGQSWYYSEYSDAIFLNGITDGNGWSGFEGWLMGDPEIEVYTYVMNNQGQVYGSGNSYHDINDDGAWAYTQMDHPYTSFDVDQYPQVYMAFWENDGIGDSDEQSTQTVAGGVTYKVYNGDDYIGAKWMNRISYPGWWWQGKGYVHKLSPNEDVNNKFFIKVSGFTGRTDK